ncbi:hypothetical protein LSUE1_G009822 [Lachnellula suecica]|uniref:Uncharacterized protein n=1 Tax=Lachnellula suecica TaxID=602035 RepID=A0A8T9BY98_9HELO|nr:hypothetical protein LSUE1_G009822 [Lachnellula suecica]
MSTSAQEGPAVPPEKGRRLSLLVTRMKTVLKRSDGSKRLSFSSKPAAAATAAPSTAGPSTINPEQPTFAAPQEPIQTPSPVTTKPELPTGPHPQKVSRAEIDAERARKLGERFKVTLDPIPWPADMDAYRIEKPIRMRIHRSCHRCSVTFGSSKTCVSCQHVRCTKCPRYPPKGTATGTGEKTKTLLPGAIEPDDYWNLRDVVELRMPNPRGGQPLVRKKPMQRVRRTCCGCETMFTASVKVCGKCAHVRAKRKKYPDGYPGDAPSSNTALPVKYACHRCAKVFPPIPHPGSGLTQPVLKCVQCEHERCSECPRAPFVKVEPEPDPEVLRRVQAKLAALHVKAGSAAS